MLFKDVLHEQLAGWLLGYFPYGGPDFGEIAQVARTVGDGGDDAFHDAWIFQAERRLEEAHTALQRGHPASARDAFLRAACCFAKSYHPLYGDPVDPRLLKAARCQIDAFERALALDEPAAIRLDIPYEGTRMPAWLIPARAAGQAPRPLIVFNNGYDATVTDSYFACAVAAVRRGYHSLVFDGPGQGVMLFEHGLRLRPDWENVIRPVLDAVQRLPQVDPQRIVLSGWSLGGYLAPRAASMESRLAACITDPGRINVADGFRAAALQLGAHPEEVRHLGDLPQALVARMERLFMQDRLRRWSVVRRGYWVHGVDNLRDYLASLEAYTLAATVGQIRCPTLVTLAADDPISDGAEAFYDALACPKTLIRFTALDGAGGHCEMGNRSLLNRRVLDWLDETLT